MQERVKSKSRVTLEIDTALIAAAAAEGVDLASLLELALQSRIRGARGQGLSAEDREAIEATERYVAEHGTWVVDWQKL